MTKLKESKRILLLIGMTLVISMLLTAVAGASTLPYSKEWTGQGSDSENCGLTGTTPERTSDGWIHWIITGADGVEISNAEVTLGGSGSGTYPATKKAGGSLHVFTPYYDVETLTAVLHYDGVLETNSQFTISDYCPGEDGNTQEVLEVRKTVETSYTRTHEWSIDKSVDTENGYTHEGYPKIWLYTDGRGDEAATWTVDITNEGYIDSDWKVSGEITIENSGDTDAVITAISDVMAGTPVTLELPVTLPYTLPAGGTLTYAYSESVDSQIEGTNTVTVTTDENTYPSNPVDIIWGDPTKEVNKEVTVDDSMYGNLGTVTAPDNGQFTYTKDFAWTDYGAGGDYQYDNIATIVETGQEDDATLLVNVQPKLTVTKTVETSYTRTHEWSIDKSVDTENGYTHEGYPKIWLYTDGRGDEAATWTVDITNEGYTDSDFLVSGTIIIEGDPNVATVITAIDDEMAGTPVTVTLPDGVALPYTLPAGGKLTCTYSESVASPIEGTNNAEVTTSPGVWPVDAFKYEGSASIEWSDPTTEVDKTITVKDISDLFGDVTLGTVTAPDNGKFTYTKDFSWKDYGKDGCGDYIYDNTATIIETEQSASATLKVNVQCYKYETAYAKGGSTIDFIPTFTNWGWTNPIAAPGNTYTWNLWAGAAQCDTSKGTLVGTVTVTYGTDGYVTATYNVDSPYIIKETHVYAGTKMFPQVKVGKNLVYTVAPGQYTNVGPFSGPIYVIAHAVVGIPDPTFGP